jgi:glycosyltransferase involved in cell wall biosynthesis
MFVLKVMVVGGYAERYIERCIESVYSQKYENWECQVILDPVGDNSYDKAVKYQNKKLKVKLNEIRQYGLANFLEASKLLNPLDNDIMVMLDADDWLASPDTFSILISKYIKNPKLLLTHGTWESYPPIGISSRWNYPYTQEDFKTGVRKIAWRASHLRTCKYKLWKRVKDEDLRDPSGKYFTVTWDLAFMFPMLEMAGFNRVEFIPEILYIYNMETPFNDYKINSNTQVNTETYIRNRPPYEILGEI